VAAIPLTGWFQSLLRSSGFRQVNEIVVLVWENTEVPGDDSSRDFQIRPMRKDDIEAVSKVDHLAFQIPWQVSYDGLTAGFLQSAVATVAVIDQTIVGYQISTSTIKGGHLARLAVLPDIQNLGIGTALVRDMQRRFYRQGIFVVTVNTQRDNASSLALYKKTGFSLTDEVYPVYQYP
jgi:ribosomal protein S18 acetylase RimI-like enzyme